MAATYLSRFLSAVAANERAMRELFQSLATFAAGELTRRVSADGSIPRSATYEIQQAIGDRVTSMFVARTGGDRREPFQTLSNGIVIPLARYPRVLWDSISTVTRIPVEQNAAIMRQRLPANVMAAMNQATENPFARAREVVSEQVFRPNPLARYEAPHTWVDPNGYTLSDRIWNTAGDTRRRLDLFLDHAIRSGRGALDVSRELEVFLLPGRTLQTKAPYGIDASYEAMRLARTEIARAHASASEASAAMNPFVNGLKWTLSRSHSKRDICDDHAEGGPNGDGVYPLDNHPTMPAHPHDLCHWQYVTVSGAEQQAILDELRADVLRTRAELVDLVGPLKVEEFTQRLLGQELEVRRATPTTTPATRPARRRTPAEVQPPSRRPAGTPVSRTVQGPSRGQNKAAVEDSLAAVDAVHGDGQMKDVPVKFGKMTTRDGHYKSYAKSGTPIEIKVSTLSKTPRSTLTHEIGHYIDGQALHITRELQSGTLSREVKAWYDAIHGSQSVASLQEMYRDPTAKITVMGINASMQMSPDRGYLRYALRYDELWARSYSQYIATRSRSAALLTELTVDQTGPYPMQWSADDFRPIAEAIDSLFRAKGWMQ